VKITYQHTFACKCPVDESTIVYVLQIVTSERIMAERIVQACDEWPVGLHEDIAEDLQRQLGGFQTLRAQHGQVVIVTETQPEAAEV